MKTDITKKVDKLNQKIRELVAEKLALMVKEADSALEQLMKEHGVAEVRVVKSPFESEIVVPGIRFKQAGRDFRFTRFAVVNKVVHAKVQEILNAGEEETLGPESPEWTPLYMLKKDADLDPSTLHLDETIQFLVDDEYAWKNLQFNEVDAMFDDEIKDPFKTSPVSTHSEDTEIPKTSTSDLTAIFLELASKLAKNEEEQKKLLSQAQEFIPDVIKNAMTAHEMDEVILLPVGSNGMIFKSELKDDASYQTLNSMRVLSSSGSSSVSGIIMLRLALCDNKLMYHGAEIKLRTDGNLDLPDTIRENNDTPWFDLATFHNTSGLVEIAKYLVTDEWAWEYTAQNSNCLNLYRLSAEKIAELSGEPYMQRGFASKLVASIGLSKLDTSSAVDMSCMFYSSPFIEELDLTSFNTSNCKSMQAMFMNCVSLKHVDVSSFDTSSVTTFESMFDGCKKLGSIDLSNFDTSSVTTFQEMFNKCESLTKLDLSNFDTSNVENFSMMFKGCKHLVELDLRGFKINENVESNGLKEMFDRCDALREIRLTGSDKNTVKNIIERLYLDDIEKANILSDFSNLTGIVEDLYYAMDDDEDEDCSQESDEEIDGVSAIQEEALQKVSEYVKTILESHGVNEVVLASPVRPDYALSDYEEGFDMEGLEPDVNAADVEEWWMPEWLISYNDSILEIVPDTHDTDDDFPQWGQRDSTLLVRLGIVDDEVKYTKQPKWFNEMTYESGEEPESDWLPIDSISNIDFWKDILQALMELDDIWTFTAQYPNLHRLTE